MNVLLAFDKFKNSLTAQDACRITRDTLAQAHPDWTLESAPLTDGGEGFADILTQQLGGEIRILEVTGPRGKPCQARYGIVDARTVPSEAREMLDAPAEGTIAVIEMAQASGLQSLPESERDPWRTTTYGTGQLIGAAAESGCRMILLGVGGSATNDIGVGALQAIGLEVHDAQGQPLDPASPFMWGTDTRLAGEVWPHIPDIRIACDVTNPLLGPNGATSIYGPQKGLKEEDKNELERAVGNMAKRLCTHCGRDRSAMMMPGAGAAGGIAFGLHVGCDARLIPGFELVGKWLSLHEKLERAGLVVTGEGRFDASSLQGKGPGSVARSALEAHKRVCVFAGALDRHAREFLDDSPHAQGVAISPEDMPLPEALQQGPDLLRQAVEQTLG